MVQAIPRLSFDELDYLHHSTLVELTNIVPPMSEPLASITGQCYWGRAAVVQTIPDAQASVDPADRELVALLAETDALITEARATSLVRERDRLRHIELDRQGRKEREGQRACPINSHDEMEDYELA
jgi:hypothetical protein